MEKATGGGRTMIPGVSRLQDVTAFVHPANQRYLLHSLRYAKDGNYFEATDGRLLIRVELNPDYVDSRTPNLPRPKSDVLIPPEIVSRAIAASKARKKKGVPASECWLEVDEESNEVSAVVERPSDNTRVRLSSAAPDGKYPDADKILNDLGKEEDPFVIKLSANLLHRLTSFVRNQPGINNQVITFTFATPSKAVLFESGGHGDGPKIRGLLLPVVEG